MIVEILTKAFEKLTGESLLTAGLLFLTAFGSAVVAYWRTVDQKSWSEFFEWALPKEVLLHPSARADALFWVVKRLIMPFLLIPAGIVFVTATAFVTNKVVGGLLNIHEPWLKGAPGPVVVIIFTLTMLLAYDISYYLYHKAQHRFPMLWELHKVHHSAEVMVGITKDRVHPLDELLNRMWDGIIPGIAFGLWTLIALDPVEVTVFGLNVYVIRNILMMDFVRHTHLKISFGPLNNLVLCPHWHQAHHSVDPRHYDKNFGLLFSFWDRLFGTLYVPVPDEGFRFGLMDRDAHEYQSLFGLYILPLKKIGRRIVRLVRGRPKAAKTLESHQS